MKQTKKLASNEVTSNTMTIDIPIKTLEKSLLHFEERLSNQEFAMEALTQKLDKNSPSSANGDTTKSIKSLESKTKTIFDAVNIQQNSIDNLLDKLAENAKDRKRTKDQMSTIQNNIAHHIRQNSGMLSEVKSEIGQLNQSDKLCSETISTIQSQVNMIKQHNKEYDKTLSSISSEVQKITQAISQLTAVVSEMKQEISHLKAEGSQSKREQEVKQVQPPIWNQLLVELSETRRETKDWFKELHQQINQLDTSNQQGLFNTEAESNQLAATLGESKVLKLGANSKNEKRHEIARTGGTASPKLNPPEKQTAPNGNTTGKNAGPKMESTQGQEAKPTTVKQSSNDSSTKIDEKARESYRRETTKPATNRNDSAQKRNNNPLPENRPLPKITHSKQEEGKTRRYRSRKCVIIHDPYFDQFDKAKFSRWYDVSMIRHETLEAAKSDTSLLKKIKKIEPEVVFVHVGQADLLNKTPGNNVVANMKGLIQNLMKDTKFKICISLIIPLATIPQVRSTIRQTNREISAFVSAIRKTEEGKDRVFNQNNDALGGFVNRSTGSHGIVFSLSERGLRKLWLHLRDGLNRSLNLSIPASRSSNGNPPRSQNHHE